MLDDSPENSTAQTGELLDTGSPDIIQPSTEPSTDAARAQAVPVGQVPPGDGQTAEAPTEGQPTWPEEFRARYPGIAAKFKDPTALAESYEGLERQFTVFRQAGLTPEDALAALVRRPEAETPTEPEPQFDAQAFFDTFAENPVEAITGAIMPQVERILSDRINATLATRDAWLAVVAKHPDAASYDAQLRDMSPAIAQMVANGVPLQDAMERAVLILKGTAPSADADRARIRAEERENARAQVLGTAVERGTGGGSPTVGQTPEQKIADEILAQSPGLTLRSVG